MERQHIAYIIIAVLIAGIAGAILYTVSNSERKRTARRRKREKAARDRRD